MRTRRPDQRRTSPAEPMLTTSRSNRPCRTRSSGAAKDLGNQFGLSLYDDGSTKSVLGSSLAHPDIKPKAGEWVWRSHGTVPPQ